MPDHVAVGASPLGSVPFPTGPDSGTRQESLPSILSISSSTRPGRS